MNQKIFGFNSEEYLATIPDSIVWSKHYPASSNFTEFYLSNQTYKDLPIVGISQQQATDFCKWRSDRFFELLLIKNSVIQQNFNQNADDYFSISNYFKGNYNNTTPDVNHLLYPEFRLPSKDEWILLSEQISMTNVEKSKNDKRKDYHLNLSLENNVNEWLANNGEYIPESNVDISIATTNSVSDNFIGFRTLLTWKKMELVD